MVEARRDQSLSQGTEVRDGEMDSEVVKTGGGTRGLREC